MTEKELKIPFKAPLHELDSETQTFGCRANNPDICANCYMPGVCAFVSNDSICRKPSNAWKKQYNKLKETQK
jgi:hypothetical protein